MKRVSQFALTAILTLTAWLCATGASAQKHVYPDYDNELPKLKVNALGKRPNILDFATTYLNYTKEEGELYSAVDVELQKYLKRKPLSKDVTFIVDTKNGYMKYEVDFKEANEQTVVEMCYWNCADGMQKLFCVNTYLIMDGEYASTEFTGREFFVYDNATKEMRMILSEDIGALFDGDGVSVFFLPRKGKDIKVSVGASGERWEEKLVWNGFDFQ